MAVIWLLFDLLSVILQLSGCGTSVFASVSGDKPVEPEVTDMNLKIAELKERKRELGYSNKMISDISGVPLSTVQKIFGGSTETPRYETLLKIEHALFPADRELRQYDPYYLPGGGLYKMYVKDPEEAYSYESFYGYDKGYTVFGKKQGEYTVDDYYTLPDDVRVELIDGVFYDMASPSPVHQMIITQTAKQIGSSLDKSGGECEVFVSPLDVQFATDNVRDLLQPDLLIVCEQKKYLNETGKILGAPDMVMEVLSPSTRGKDRVRKLKKYMVEGVKEYWIVDPEAAEIQVYCFGKTSTFNLYTFEDRIPINIFDGEISVNFAAINRRLRDRLGFDPK